MNRGSSGWRGMLRRLSITSMLLAIAVVASMGGTLRAAQAQDGPVHEYRTIVKDLELRVEPASLKNVCVGQTVRFSVFGHADISIYGRPQEVHVEHFPYISEVNAVPSNKGLGLVTPPAKNSAPDIGASVAFTGKKPGTGTILVMALAVNPIDKKKYLMTRVISVEVLYCDLIVSASVNVAVHRLAQVRVFKGTLYPVLLKSNDNGAGFTASGVLAWGEDIDDSSCDSVWTEPALLTTPAHVTASIEDEGVVVDIEFDELNHRVCGACFGVSTCLNDHWEWDPVHVYFPDIESIRTTIFSNAFEVTLERSAAKVAP